MIKEKPFLIADEFVATEKEEAGVSKTYYRWWKHTLLEGKIISSINMGLLGDGGNPRLMRAKPDPGTGPVPGEPEGVFDSYDPFDEVKRILMLELVSGRRA